MSRITMPTFSLPNSPANSSDASTPESARMDWEQTSPDVSPIIYHQRYVPFQPFTRKRTFDDFSDSSELAGRQPADSAPQFVPRFGHDAEEMRYRNSYVGIAARLAKRLGLTLYYVIISAPDHLKLLSAKRRILSHMVHHAGPQDLLVRATTPVNNRHMRNIFVTPPRSKKRSPRSERVRDMPGRFPGATSSPPFVREASPTQQPEGVDEMDYENSEDDMPIVQYLGDVYASDDILDDEPEPISSETEPIGEGVGPSSDVNNEKDVKVRKVRFDLPVTDADEASELETPRVSRPIRAEEASSKTRKQHVPGDVLDQDPRLAIASDAVEISVAELRRQRPENTVTPIERQLLEKCEANDPFGCWKEEVKQKWKAARNAEQQFEDSLSVESVRKVQSWKKSILAESNEAKTQVESPSSGGLEQEQKASFKSNTEAPVTRDHHEAKIAMQAEVDGDFLRKNNQAKAEEVIVGRSNEFNTAQDSSKMPAIASAPPAAIPSLVTSTKRTALSSISNNCVQKRSTAPRVFTKIIEYFKEYMPQRQPAKPVSMKAPAPKTPPPKTRKRVLFYRSPCNGRPVTDTKYFVTGKVINYPLNGSPSDESVGSDRTDTETIAPLTSDHVPSEFDASDISSPQQTALNAQSELLQAQSTAESSSQNDHFPVEEAGRCVEGAGMTLNSTSLSIPPANFPKDTSQTPVLSNGSEETTATSSGPMEIFIDNHDEGVEQNPAPAIGSTSPILNEVSNGTANGWDDEDTQTSVAGIANASDAGSRSTNLGELSGVTTIEHSYSHPQPSVTGGGRVNDAETTNWISLELSSSATHGEDHAHPPAVYPSGSVGSISPVSGEVFNSGNFVQSHGRPEHQASLPIENIVNDLRSTSPILGEVSNGTTQMHDQDRDSQHTRTSGNTAAQEPLEHRDAIETGLTLPSSGEVSDASAHEYDHIHTSDHVDVAGDDSSPGESTDPAEPSSDENGNVLEQSDQEQTAISRSQQQIDDQDHDVLMEEHNVPEASSSEDDKNDAGAAPSATRKVKKLEKTFGTMGLSPRRYGTRSRSRSEEHPEEKAALERKRAEEKALREKRKEEAKARRERREAEAREQKEREEAEERARRERAAQEEAQRAQEEAQRAQEEAERRAQTEREAAEEREEVDARRVPKETLIQPLSPEWTRKVQDALRKRMTDQVATTVTSRTMITRRDIGKLLPQAGTGDDPAGWLNDEVISAYLEAVVAHYHTSIGHQRGETPKIHAFNPFFYTNLKRQGGYSNVRRWAGRAKIGGNDLLKVNFVLIPANVGGNHWTLVVVSPVNKTIEYFDSLHFSNLNPVHTVRLWLAGELGAAFKPEEWTVKETESGQHGGHGQGPSQDNGSDCGVFACTTAKMVALGVDPMSYGAADMPLQRRRIVAELINGGFVGEFAPHVEFE